MNGEIAVVNILLNTAAVTQYVGNRVYMDQAPQKAKMPYIIVESRDVDPIISKSGKAETDIDIIGVIPYCEKKFQLIQLSTECRNALDHKESGIYNSVNIDQMIFMGQNAFDEEIENRNVYATDQEYTLRVRLYGLTADRTDITVDSDEVTVDNS